jgi:hypothetical protein
MNSSLEKIKDIEQEMVIALEEENFKEFDELLNEQKLAYEELAEQDPQEAKNYLNSVEYKSNYQKINDLCERKKAEIKEEVRELNLSKRASEGYRSNTQTIRGFFSKKI